MRRRHWDDIPDICWRLRDVREAAGWSQAEFGRWMPRPRSHAAVSDIERGKTTLTLDILRAYAGLCGTSLTALVKEGD